MGSCNVPVARPLAHSGLRSAEQHCGGAQRFGQYGHRYEFRWCTAKHQLRIGSMRRRGQEIAILALASLISTFATRGAFALGDNSVTANGCSLAAGRDVTSTTVNCQYGLTPEQVQELTKAAISGAVGPLRETIVDLSKRLGVTEDATKKLLRIVGETDPPLDRLADKLSEVANDYRRLRAQTDALNPKDALAQV